MMMKRFTLKPLAIIAMAGLFYGCQQEDLAPATTPIKMESRAASVIDENCDVLDFENPGFFPRDTEGYITGVISQKGANVKVTGYARTSTAPATQWGTTNRANIFYTTGIPNDHPDGDLKTPNWNNTTPSLGNVLIVQELVAPHNIASDPNDNAHGGKLEFSFAELGSVTVNSMDVLDIEQHYELKSRVDFYDKADSKINTTDIFIAPTGNNGVAKVTFPEMKGVVKMIITFDGAWNPTTNAGSGAIDNIEFCKEIPPVPPCLPCEGKVNSLTMKYNGPDNANLIASVKVGFFYLPIYIIKDLDAGETFTLNGVKNPDKRPGYAGTLSTELVLVSTTKGRINTTVINTGCDKPIYQSYEDGMYTTLEGTSKIGGKLCEFAPAPEKEECDKHKCRHKCDKKCEDKGKKKCVHKCNYKDDHKDKDHKDNDHRDNDHKSWDWKW
jgi:hypothetical protein